MAVYDRAADLQKKRGLDPHALKVLEMRKQKKQEREQLLKQEKHQREINRLKSRMAVIDRELQRLNVQNRRAKSGSVQEERELQKEVQDVLEVNKELREHQIKVEKLKQELGEKRGVIERAKTLVRGDASDEHQRQLDSLHAKLQQIDNEIERLENKRRQVLSAVSKENQALHNSSLQQQEKERALARAENDLQTILQSVAREESIHNRMMAQMRREEQEAKAQRTVVEQIQQRTQGAVNSIPALERDKQRIEQQIRELENQARQTA